MFELAQQAVGLWCSQNSVNHKEGPRQVFLQNMRLKIYAQIRFVIFLCFWFSLFCDMSTSYLFNTSCGLKVLIKKGLIKKFILGKNWRNSCLFLLWTRLPKKRKNLSLNSHFCHYQNFSYVCKQKIKLKVTQEYRKSSKRSKENR